MTDWIDKLEYHLEGVPFPKHMKRAPHCSGCGAEGYARMGSGFQWYSKHKAVPVFWRYCDPCTDKIVRPAQRKLGAWS